jgi:hypothetical protein
MKKAHPITFNIYAESPDEAEKGKTAIISFISMVAQQGAMVSGDKLEVAVAKLADNPFIKSQIINFFK